MRCKSGRTYVRQQNFKIDHPNPKSFLRKIVSLTILYQKTKHCFLKVLTKFYKEISKIVSTNIMKEH